MPPERIVIRDHKIETVTGAVFVRDWEPSAATGTPLILLHDSLGCVDAWRDFPALLASTSDRRVLAYDRLGFGRSSARFDALSSCFVREESEVPLPQVLRSLQLERFIAVGHSVGGGMAMYCGDTLRKSCAGIITMAAQMFAEPKTLRAIAEAKQVYADRAQLARLEKYHGSKAAWVLRAWTDTWLSKEFASWSMHDTLPLIRCPILAFHGELDEFGSLEHPRMIESLAGGRKQAIVLKGVGHVPHREQPGTVIRLVSEFIATL